MLNKYEKDKKISYSIYNISLKSVSANIHTSCNCSVASSDRLVLKPFSKGKFYIQIDAEKASDNLIISVNTDKNKEVMCNIKVIKK